jgi:heme/copper-type cytochrome/quinol oxidase subunit 2
MSEESYSCLNSTAVKDPNIEAVFKYGLPEYKKISGFSIFINSMVLFIELYFISAVFVFYYNKAKGKVSRRMKEALEISGIITVVLVIIFAVLYYIYLWRLL